MSDILSEGLIFNESRVIAKEIGNHTLIISAMGGKDRPLVNITTLFCLSGLEAPLLPVLARTRATAEDIKHLLALSPGFK